MKALIDYFWGNAVTGKAFVPFTPPHFIGVLLICVSIHTLFKYESNIKQERVQRRIEISLALLLGLQQIFLYAWYITSGNFTLSESLPLYSCRIAILATIYILLSRNHKVFEVIYFWGLVGGLVALITPDTSGFNFPHFMLIQYFVGHGTLIFSILYMVVIHGFKPNLSALFNTYKITSLYFVLIFFINKLLNGNYSYLNGKPNTPTILDSLPPYPFYIPILLGAMFFLFFVAYIPFIKEDKQSNVLEETF